MSLVSHEKSSFIYKKLLNWVMEDKSLGLICSPKRPRTLLTRMPELDSYIEKARGTNRCIFMQGNYATDNYPAEVTLAADITISLLGGGSTALEGYLSGSRVVCLDLEHFYSYPEYSWGKNKIVFDNLDTLITSIKEYRYNKQAFEELGNLDKIANLNEKDPFRDGKASSRMGEYIKWLLEMFNHGKTKNEAIEYANKRYMKMWGRENIYLCTRKPRV
jgi:hypothetical protein